MICNLDRLYREMNGLMQLVWGAIGAVVGFGAGVLAYFVIYKMFPEQLGQVPTLSMVAVFALGGGGMMGGGWLALYLAARRDKAKRDNARAERKTFGAKRRQ